MKKIIIYLAIAFLLISSINAYSNYTNIGTYINESSSIFWLFNDTFTETTTTALTDHTPDFKYLQIGRNYTNAGTDWEVNSTTDTVYHNGTDELSIFIEAIQADWSNFTDTNKRLVIISEQYLGQDAYLTMTWSFGHDGAPTVNTNEGYTKFAWQTNGGLSNQWGVMNATASSMTALTAGPNINFFTWYRTIYEIEYLSESEVFNVSARIIRMNDSLDLSTTQDYFQLNNSNYTNNNLTLIFITNKIGTQIDNLSVFLYEIPNSLTVYVRDAQTGANITTNVSATLTGDDYQKHYTTTNARFFSYGHPNGDYNLKLSAEGYDIRNYFLTFDDENQIMTAYLNSNLNSTTFTVRNKLTSESIQDILCSMYRQINGSWQAVESRTTDITGRVKFTFENNINYKFYFSKLDFEDYVFNLYPILFDEYDVWMSPTSTINQTPEFKDIAIHYYPTTFYNDQDNNFTFAIQNILGNLNGYGYQLIHTSGTESNSGTNPTGEILNNSGFTITGATYDDLLTLHYWYDTNASGVKNFTKHYTIISIAGNATISSIKNATYGLGLLERVLITTFIILLLVGITSLSGQSVFGFVMGLAVLGFLVYVGFISFWFILLTGSVALFIIPSHTGI